MTRVLPQRLRDHPFAAYVAPIVIFGLFTAAEGYVPRPWYPATYAAKITAVCVSLIVFPEALGDFRPSWSVVPASCAVGLGLFVAWVGLDRWIPYPHLGGREAFDPATIGSLWARVAFLGLRFFGLVLVVPVIEELFWRSFVLRYQTDADFLKVPIGTFTLQAFVVMVGLSAITHSEWLVAIVAAVVFGLWLARTKSLFAVVVVHGVTNAALGAYVLLTGDWKYW